MSIKFKVIKQSTTSRARVGLLETSHGVVETPAYVPVATQAALKTLDSADIANTKTQIMIANTYHLHLRPGEQVVARTGGLHKFMNWQGGLMTDSGGFQVFSLGFGRDLKTSKVLKVKSGVEVKHGQQPKLLNITDDGVEFRTHIDGAKMFLGPRESIKIQEQLGADIILAFDECPPPSASKKYLIDSLQRTHNWAKVCLQAHQTKQALYGIVQGGRFKDLRISSAHTIASLPFDGFAIGGEFGVGKQAMSNMLKWVVGELPANKPRHLLGIGYEDDLLRVIKSGVDTFDCIVPTHYARHGYAFTSHDKLNLAQAKFQRDQKPLDAKCKCMVCQGYTRSYISHLIRAHEITGLKLLTMHNVWYFNVLVAQIRDMIKRGKL